MGKRVCVAGGSKKACPHEWMCYKKLCVGAYCYLLPYSHQQMLRRLHFGSGVGALQTQLCEDIHTYKRDALVGSPLLHRHHWTAHDKGLSKQCAIGTKNYMLKLLSMLLMLSSSLEITLTNQQVKAWPHKAVVRL